MKEKMDKQEKKKFRKAKRKAIGLYKALSWISGVVAVISMIALIVCTVFDNTMAAFVGGSFWDVKNPDASKVYFKSDFTSNEELAEYGDLLVKRVEAEGAALLMNENNALPLTSGAKISLFSNSSVNPVYGGTGSGNIDASKADNFRTAMEKAGFSVNDVLWSFYEKGAGSKYKRKSGGTIAMASAVVSEVPVSVYTEDAKNSVKNFGDAAVVILSRIGGEGADLEATDFNYLALDQNEKDMLKMIADMKKSGDIKKIILLINSANALQVDFLKDNEYNIDSVLWIGDIGITGVNAVAEILAGIVNPSGSLVDTYCFDNYSAPAMKNYLPVQYLGYKKGIVPDTADTYMIYQEGIYVGYKYYETRYEDMVTGKGNTEGYDYSADVAYPFGYGLSYTTFELSDMAAVFDANTGKASIKVNVKNTGDVAGKKTVQIYVQSPYTEYDKANKVEKASVALVGFGKTKLLAPGEEETLEITVDMRDVASYDAYGKGTYILEDGEYYFATGNGAHEAVNNILSFKGYTASNSNMDADGNKNLVVAYVNDKFDDTTYATSVTGAKIENQLSQSDINLYKGAEGQKVTYLSRKDWAGTMPKEPVQLKLTEQLISDLQIIQYDASKYAKTAMPVMGAKNGLKLYDMVGLPFDDPKWDKLLDQMTFKEMVTLIGDAFHWTMPVQSIQSPGTRDENGPQGLTASLLASDKTQIKATAFTSEDVMAATFNTELMAEIGRVIGNDCLAANISCLYGPGNNLHRTPYGGRNFEYYSEDGFLSGKMSAYEVAEIEKKGVQVVMKHFALNDCEADRLGLGVWLTEQSAREIYLKCFEDTVEEGHAGGVMTAYTRWGAIWSGGNYNLMTNILRNEWGCNGKLITDNVLTQYVNGVDGIMAGVTIFDAMMPFVTNLLPKYKNDPVVVSRMREACHYNLYAVANGNGMNNIGPDTVIKAHELGLLTKLRVIMIVALVIFAASLTMTILKKKKFMADYKA